MRDHEIIHRNPGIYGLIVWGTCLMWDAASLLMCYGFWDVVQTMPTVSPFIGQPEESVFLFNAGFTLIVGVFTIGVILLMTVIALRMIMAYPTIVTAPHGFKIITLLHRSDWLPWSAIRSVHTPLLLPALKLAIPALPTIYLVNGWLWFGTKTIMVTEHVERYDVLEARLREHRPELF